MEVRKLLAGAVIIFFSVSSVTGLFQSLKQQKASVAKRVSYWSSRQDKMQSVNLLLYTRNSIDTPLLLNPDDVSTLKAADIHNDTIFMIHGWRSNRNIFMEAKNAYLKNRDVNVVIIEWDQLASNLYTKSKNDLEVVGSQVAQLADALIYAGHDPANLHIVGHSLGGHMSGIAASKMTKGKVGRITALDAAGPNFKSLDIENMVDSTDAEFVQSIHTNAGVLGYKKPLGHADFYVNDGKNQPGCSSNDMGICSHMRVVDLFVQSVIDGKSFLAHKCSSRKNFFSGKCKENPTAYMGDSCSPSTRGVYFVKTGSVSPYSFEQGE